MRKRFSIFMFLFAAVGLAGAARAEKTAGYPYYEKGGTTTSDANVVYSTDGVNYTAIPPAGRKVGNWGWAKTSAEAMNYNNKGLYWEKPDKTGTTYAVPTSGQKVAVRFDYIPLTVTFNGNGGSGSMEAITNKNIDSSFTLTANKFTKTGYHFAHWANDLQKTFADQASVSGGDFWDTASAKFHADLKAQWAANTYTVHFDGNGATGGSMDDEPFSYDETKALTANAFEKTGFAFDGWATNATEGAVIYKDKVSVRNLTTNDNATVNLYARWAQKYTVTFREDEKFTATTPEKDGILKIEYVVSGGSATPPSDPAHTGYRFNGWSGTYTAVTKNENVYATYQANSYRVIFHANDGSGRTSEESFVYGEPKALLPMSRTGYVLKGWAESPDAIEPKYQPGEVVANLATGGEVHLYALWTPISYSVAFDANGGEGEMEPVSLDYDAAYIVPECAFTKTGCEFESWQVLVGGKAVTNFLAGTTVSNLTSKAGATVTFKANWTGYYTIAFDKNGGEGEMVDEKVERDVGFQLPPNAFTRIGYDFTTWTTNLPPNDKSIIADGATVTNLVAAGETCTLHALWEAHRYTITFRANGGKGTDPEDIPDCAYDSEIPLPTPSYVPPKNYATFIGWSTNKNDTTGISVATNLTAEAGGIVTLYAVWHYDVGPWSEVLDCDNLKFENKDVNSLWKIDDEGALPGSDKCLSHENEYELYGKVYAELDESGTLTYWWKGRGDGDEHIFWVCLTEDESWDPTIAEDTSIDSRDIRENQPWTKSTVKITVPAGEKRYIWFAHDASIPVSLDCVTWEPDRKEPEYDDVDTPVTGLSMSDGKLGFAFSGSGSTYHLLGTNDVLAPMPWPMVFETNKASGVILFKIPVKADEPKMFYRIRALK